MFLASLPAKWKKALPFGLTSLGSLAIFFQIVLEGTWGVLPNIFAFGAILVGALFGVLWTPPDVPE